MRLLFAVSAVLMALLTACGENETLTKAQYVSKLNAMCRDFSEREQAIGEPQSLDDLVEKGPRIADAFEEAIADKVHELRAPNQISDQANRLARLADEQRSVLRGLVDAAKRNDFEQVTELASKNAMLNRESGSIAKELGASACS